MFAQLLDECCAPQIEEPCGVRNRTTGLIERTSNQVFLDTPKIGSEIEAFARNIGDRALLNTILLAIADWRRK